VKLEATAAIACVIGLLLFGMTFQQTKMYRSLDSLWRATLTQTGQKSWLAANNYGVLLLERGDLNTAEAWFLKVIRLRPDHPESRRNLARIAIRRAQLAEALRARAATNPTTQLTAMIPATQPSEYYDQAIGWYREALEKQPNYIDGHFFLAQLLLARGREDEALTHLKRTLALYPRHVQAHLESGSLALKRGLTDDAFEHFLRAVEIDPESSQAHARLGTTLLLKGRLGDGLAQWDDAMRLAPLDANLPNDFGARMASSGEYLKAIDYFRRALQIDPRNVDAWTNYGVVAVLAGYPEQAEQWFKRALEIDPKFPKALENLAALREGRLRPATKPATRAATSPTAAP
jgi:tetratricopeptide (TPR) repeat protein